MQNAGKFLKRTFLSYLLFIGTTLLVLLLSFLLFRFFSYVDSLESAGLLGLPCALLCLLFYPGAIALGAALVWGIGRITQEDLRLKWLPILLGGAALILYGYLIYTQSADRIAFPTFMRPLTDVLHQGKDLVGMYLMLYGGEIALMLLFSPKRTLYTFALPKLLVSFALLLFVYGLLHLTMHSSKSTFFTTFVVPVLLFFSYPACIFAGYYLPHLFAWNVGGHMKPFFWLLYLLGGLITLAGLALLVTDFFFNSALRTFVYQVFHFLPYDVRKLLIDTCGVPTALMLLAIGLPWLIGVIMTTRRCPECGRYAPARCDDHSESSRIVGSYSAQTERLMHTTKHLLTHDEHYHKYDDRYETEESTTSRHYICRYCHADLGWSDNTSTYDRLVYRRKTGERNERHFL